MFRKILRSFADLLFPPLCLHCQNTCPASQPIFCQACLKLMDLIDPEERCPFCFSHLYDPESKICEECARHPPLLDRVAAVFDYTGPPATLIKRMKYGNLPHLAKGAGSYMAMQFLQLGWPLPDLLTPIPISYLRRLERGFNQSLLLCEGIGSILHVPIGDILKRKSGDYSQAGLTRKQRASKEQNISLKKGCSIYKKNILLVDDVMTTGSTLQKCAEVLLEQEPATIYALVFCRATRCI